MKFVCNIKELKIDVIHTSKRVRFFFYLLLVHILRRQVATKVHIHYHARLGHLSMENLKTMLKLNLIKELSSLTKFCERRVCEGCQFEKDHRCPFDKSILWCQAPLELMMI